MTTQIPAGARPRPSQSSAAPLPDQVTEATLFDLSEVFKMLADRSRLKIMFALAQLGAMNVTALKKLLEKTQTAVSQPAVSHHLALLRGARLVRCDRQGKQCFYRIESSKLRELIERFFTEVANGNRQIQLEDLALSLKRR